MSATVERFKANALSSVGVGVIVFVCLSVVSLVCLCSCCWCSNEIIRVSEGIFLSKEYSQLNRAIDYIRNMSGYNWVPSCVGHVPPNAIECGKDSDGSKMYVGRTYFQGDQLPCKVIPRRREAYVSHNCKEHPVSNYEVLCKQRLRWISNSGRFIPHGAVPGGRTIQGEILYVGRVRHGNSETVGKVHPSHGCLYIGYGGKEISYTNYEILVWQ